MSRRTLSLSLLMSFVALPVAAAAEKKTAPFDYYFRLRHHAFSPDGARLAALDGKHAVGVWDTATGKQIASFATSPDRDPTVKAFSFDNRTLACGQRDDTVRLFDVASGKNTATFAQKNRIHALAFSPDGKTLAIACVDLEGEARPKSEVALWDLAAGKQTGTLPFPDGALISLRFSPDGKFLAAAARFKLQLWDAPEKKTVATLKARTVFGSFAFSPDSKTLAYCDAGGIGLWNTERRRKSALLAFEAKGKNSPALFAFSPDGATLAAACDDEAIRLWDVATRKQTATLEGHTEPIDALAYTPDGKTLASVTVHQASLFLWDSAAGKALRRTDPRAGK
ncbi:MAG: WD40 repeat domain-containing protein [Gemmataceae bacterium]